jgi:hypothetical protein
MSHPLNNILDVYSNHRDDADPTGLSVEATNDIDNTFDTSLQTRYCHTD